MLLLGGEGRLLSAPTDWYVRDAVLADLGRNPWPFLYEASGGPTLLRAPLGMYLLPALAGGGGQRALDLALLAANTAMLGLLLALAAALFAPGKPRRIAVSGVPAVQRIRCRRDAADAPVGAPRAALSSRELGARITVHRDLHADRLGAAACDRRLGVRALLPAVAAAQAADRRAGRRDPAVRLLVAARRRRRAALRAARGRPGRPRDPH